MGSILSFPILCLANLGVYLRTMSDVQKGWSDKERLRHVLVNGDDMVYAGPDSKWTEHIACSKAVGLEMSVGKSYVHDEYLNINSTSIVCRVSNDSTPWVIPYLNTGLFYGQHKVLGKVDSREEVAASHHDFPDGLVANLNTVLDGALPGRQDTLLKYFIHVHGEALRSECKILVRLNRKKFFVTRNLFLPISMGGMGVLPPPGWDFKITQNDRKIARSCVEKLSSRRSYLLPLPGVEEVKLEDNVKAPWCKPQSDDSDLLLRDGTFGSSFLNITNRKLVQSRVVLPCFHWRPYVQVVETVFAVTPIE